MHTQTRHALRGIVSRLLFGLLLLSATAEAHERPLFARSSRGTARRDSSETEPTGKIVTRRASPFLLDLMRRHAIRVMRQANVGCRLPVAGPSATAEATERLLFRRYNARHRAKRCDRNGEAPLPYRRHFEAGEAGGGWRRHDEAAAAAGGGVREARGSVSAAPMPRETSTEPEPTGPKAEAKREK